MIDSECSVVVRDQRALVRGVDEPVVPDPSRKGEQALSDPDGDTGPRATAVLFQPELTFEGVVDGLDALADPAQLAVAPSLVEAVGPDEGCVEFADEVLEFPSRIPLVGDDEQPWPHRQPLQHGLGDLAVTD